MEVACLLFAWAHPAVNPQLWPLQAEAGQGLLTMGLAPMAEMTAKLPPTSIRTDSLLQDIQELGNPAHFQQEVPPV